MFEKMLNSLDAVSDCQLRAARFYIETGQTMDAARAMDVHEFAHAKAARLRAAAERAA